MPVPGIGFFPDQEHAQAPDFWYAYLVDRLLPSPLVMGII